MEAALTMVKRARAAKALTSPLERLRREVDAMQELEMVASSHHIGAPRFWPLLGCARQTQTGPSAVKVCVCYISRTRSWVKPTIWLPSPPMGLTIHAGAQLQGEPRTVC